MDQLINLIKTYTNNQTFTSETLNIFERQLYNLKLTINVDELDISDEWKYILKGYYNLLNNDIHLMLENYKKSAELNNTLALYYLGLEYYEENNPNKSMMYFKKGFSKNCPLSSYMLSKIYHNKRDYQESYKYTKFCIENTEPNALYLYSYYNNYDLINESSKYIASRALIMGINKNYIECYKELIENYNNYNLTYELLEQININNNDIKNIKSKF
jgi:tetratricopeptide (TPR) repeat protein